MSGAAFRGRERRRFTSNGIGIPGPEPTNNQRACAQKQNTMTRKDTAHRTLPKVIEWGYLHGSTG